MNRVEKVDYNIFPYIISDKELYTYLVDEIPVDAVYVELILRRKNFTLKKKIQGKKEYPALSSAFAHTM